MPRETFTLNKLQVLVSPDDRPPTASCLWAIADGQVVDEQTHRGPDSPICCTTTLAGVRVNTTPDGYFALAGVPRDVLPGLATKNYPFSVTVSADGYVAQTVSGSIGPIVGFPQVFVPFVFPTVQLHRQPTVVLGWVVRRVSHATNPIVGASVAVTQLWRVLPQGGLPPVAEAPNFLSVQPALGLPRTSGVDTMRQQSYAPTALPPKTLLLQALAGSNSIVLQDAVGLAIGDLLLLDGKDPATAEVVILASVPASPIPNQPATVTAAAPLMLTHYEGGLAVQVVAAAPGTSNTLSQDALPGDSVVFLNGTGGLSAIDTAELPGASPEYHTTALFTASTDAAGYYRMPPVSRVYQITITAKDGLGGVQSQTVWPDYTVPVNQFDFVFH